MGCLDVKLGEKTDCTSKHSALPTNIAAVGVRVELTRGRGQHLTEGRMQHEPRRAMHRGQAEGDHISSVVELHPDDMLSFPAGMLWTSEQLGPQI